MAGFTEYLHLAFFDFGDKINSAINIGREIDRFTFIDKQLYGLYSIFGDGVITGWNVTNLVYDPSSGISVAISSGIGIIQAKASETYFPKSITGLPSNSTIYIYARHTNPDFSSKDSVAFVYSDASSISGFVKLAQVVTGVNAITSINNYDRDYLAIEQTIIDVIAQHKHRGSPTKIDLETETKNQLPGSKIESIDASKIVSGRLSATNIPILNHSDLTNTGVLTHAQIDTFLNTFTQTNQNLFGEVAASNLLKQTLYLKYSDVSVDDYYNNELAFIAGISPDTVIDDVNTTAIIDREDHLIAGFPFANGVSYFFTENFELTGSITKCILVSRDETFSDGTIQYGININNSINFNDYGLITPNTLTSISGTGTGMRIGIKIVSPSDLDVHDPYLADFHDFVDFEFSNSGSVSENFHFRIRFYTDIGLTTLYKTAASKDDQEGWIVDDLYAIPAEGYSVDPGQSISVTYYPAFSDFVPGQVYYLSIDIWDGSSYAFETTGSTFAVSDSDYIDKYVGIPRVYNFALLFEMDNNEFVLVNAL